MTTYFRPTTEGVYATVVPPVGAEVPQMPDGGNGVRYYVFGSTWFQPVMLGGVTACVTARS